MYDNYIRGNKGIGIITLMIIAMFAAIAAAAIFVGAVYVRAKTNENYHRRKALMLLRNEFEIIQMNWQMNGAVSNMPPGQSPDLRDVVRRLDTVDGRPLSGTIKIPRPTIVQDPLVAYNAEFIKVEATMTWEEPYIISENLERKRTIKVLLRDDFYRKRVTPGTR